MVETRAGDGTGRPAAAGGMTTAGRRSIPWRRTVGIIGWLTAAQAMIAFGSVQGVTGSLVAGGALYGIMSRE